MRRSLSRFQQQKLDAAFDRADREAALKAQGGRCKYCLIPLTLKTATRDHVVPRSKGGSNLRHNTVAACESCNKAKGNKDAKLFLRLIHEPRPGEPIHYRLIWFEWKLNLALIRMEENIRKRMGLRK